MKGAYTCWCAATGSRALNYGQRIDYILLSRHLAGFVEASSVLQDELGSDHCPVKTELAIDIIPSSQIPSLCSVHFAKFAGKQSNLLSFFSKRELTSTLHKTNPELKEKQVTTSVKDKCLAETKVTTTSKKLSSEWKHVFKGPPKPPVCTGHKEPAVLRTVKKPGPNKNKKFYVCNRPDGSKNDPNGRCNFFQWSK